MTEFYNINGIALHRIKYQDNAVILKVFTRQRGMSTYMVRGIRGKKSSKYYMTAPLSLIEFESKFRENKDIQQLRELRMAMPLLSLHSDIAKSAISMFMAEVLYKSMEDGYTNEALFDYLESSIMLLNDMENVANFHLLFMLRLSKFYGFFPDASSYSEGSVFNLEDGIFHPGSRMVSSPVVEGNLAALLYVLLGTNFDELERLKMTANERQQLLSALIDFFSLHVEGMKEINSHAVLMSVFK